ncbi:transposase [Sphaerospermopsis sp. FACHB-1094]|uniref:RNA-guided endonuclease InsQ/TnpB family protein n=1 Tax=Sphaerospermopsis sp. FACHB-1094 TaxID=2692861 RepID=UPI001F54DA9D|nr:transposase [Sphaerospermopsis sp. FACHB-1094]
MAFSNFKTIGEVLTTFQVIYTEDNFISEIAFNITDYFREDLELMMRDAVVDNSEFAICENLIYPVLKEVWKIYRQHFILWSHQSLNYDEKLSGFPEYILAKRSPLGKVVFDKPYFILVEAKQDNFEAGWAQCLAEMIAAQRLNGEYQIIIWGIVGLDLGLNYFIADSKGNVEESPKFYRKSEKQLSRANRKKSKKFSRERKKAKQRQSNNYHKARNRYARKHLRVSRQRKEYCKRLAYSVIQSNDLVAYEDLNVKGMVKNRHLAKSISDAGWSTFRQWLEYFGHKYGKVTIAVPPHNTSQNCSNCGQKVQKSLSTRTHVCHHCGFVEDRDINASINILKLGLSTVGHTGTYATGDLPSWAIGVNLSSNGESVNVESALL